MCGDERLQGSLRAAVPYHYVVVKLPLTHPRKKRTSCRQRNRITGESELSVPMSPWPTDAVGIRVQRSGAGNREYQLSCECSYKVRCEVMRHGERLGESTFFDEEASESGTALGAAADSVSYPYDLEAGLRRNPDMVSREGDRVLRRFTDVWE